MSMHVECSKQHLGHQPSTFVLITRRQHHLIFATSRIRHGRRICTGESLQYPIQCEGGFISNACHIPSPNKVSVCQGKRLMMSRSFQMICLSTIKTKSRYQTPRHHQLGDLRSSCAITILLMWRSSISRSSGLVLLPVATPTHSHHPQHTHLIEAERKKLVAKRRQPLPN